MWPKDPMKERWVFLLLLSFFMPTLIAHRQAITVILPPLGESFFALVSQDGAQVIHTLPNRPTCRRCVTSKWLAGVASAVDYYYYSGAPAATENTAPPTQYFYTQPQQPGTIRV